MMEQVLLQFIKWMDNTAKLEPMKLETDNTDIVMTFLEENPQYKSSNKVSCAWCGKNDGSKGKLITKVIHQDCYESILNGAGIIL